MFCISCKNEAFKMFWYARGIHEVVSVYGELCDFIYLCYYVIDEMPAGEQKL